jgi:hypothetical protein
MYILIMENLNLVPVKKFNAKTRNQSYDHCILHKLYSANVDKVCSVSNMKEKKTIFLENPFAI